jgi:glycosidase
LYYGEEIGMRDLLLDDPAQIRDRVSLWVYQAAIQRGDPEQDALDLALRYGRDQCRTPMQWADAPNGGFSPAGVQPWLPVNPDHACGVNVADQIEDNASMLNYYRALLRVRKANPALQVGDFQPLHQDRDTYLAYLRHSPAHKQTCLVLLNFSAGRLHVSLPEAPSSLRCLFSTHKPPGKMYSCEQITLSPYEVLIAGAYVSWAC